MRDAGEPVPTIAPPLPSVVPLCTACSLRKKIATLNRAPGRYAPLMSVWSDFIWTPQFLTGSFVSGLLGSLFTYLNDRSKFGREKRARAEETQRKARETKIAAWRQGIDRQIGAEAAGRGTPGMMSPSMAAAIGTGPPLQDTLIMRENWFTSLRDLMTEETRVQADKLKNQRPDDRPPGELARLLGSEVDRLEREWKLI
jgi:hypothetical protein